MSMRTAAVAIAAAHAACTAVPAAAQDYPTRPIHLVVGFPAGSGADIGVRFVAEKLQEVSKARVVVENKPGAGSNIAIGLVAKAKPDGYTILMAASSAMACRTTSGVIWNCSASSGSVGGRPSRANRA